MLPDHFHVLPIVASLRALLEAAQAERDSPWANVALASKGEPWSESGLNRTFQRALDRAGLDTRSYHNLRYDEPLTEAELKELEEADEEIRRSEVMTTEELKRRLGL